MKILVAGAGHGGLTAAALLSKQGHDVTVYEKKKREEIGYDWEDRFTFALLEDLTGKKIPEDSWRYRGDCAFISPSYKSSVIINYTDENRQKIMQRKPLLNMLIEFASENNVRFEFENNVSLITEDDAVKGLSTAYGDVYADLVIDACGVLSPLRSSLPEKYLVEKNLSKGELFYVRRAYFNKTDSTLPDVPFEVYLCHDREPGLSWCCVNDDSVDILIGRTEPVDKDKFDSCVSSFREKHPFIGEEIIHGGIYGTIPVRRCLPVMIAPGYAAAGDSAFMTTPMNGMGIDLSMHAGMILADEIIKSGDCSIGTLWNYNKRFIKEYGAVTAKNEGLKNSLLKMAESGVDFLFDNEVIQSSDLSGAGSDTSFSSLMGKFIRGMRNPKYFFALLGGLTAGAKLMKTMKNIPDNYNLSEIAGWCEKVKTASGKVSIS